MKNIRVRFAPSPTGLMHLGNVRAALINYLFAHQKDGTFVLRIEDTDPERNFDPGALKIQEDLKWLGLSYDEGPPALDPFGPYFQSQRIKFYDKALEHLKDNGYIYRCFCSEELLEKKRTRQIALKQPPRYDRACAQLGEDEITTALASKTPYIWRFKIDHNQTITISDLARNSVTFEMKNFSDFPVTRSNGSYTFIFANVVDDIAMRISHVFRGEDHLSNTGNQAAIYLAFQAELPTFWHMPILCNVEGRKLSKRDFGFSLTDLKDAGFLPEAILNYLGIIGGSFKDEIMPLDKLVNAFDFENLSGSGQIKYDVKKLEWVNHQWIMNLPIEQLMLLCKSRILEEFPSAQSLTDEELILCIKPIKTELKTLNDVKQQCAYFFREPTNACDVATNHIPEKELRALRAIVEGASAYNEDYLAALKKEAKAKNIPFKYVFSFLRIALTGSATGPSVDELISTLGITESKSRIQALAKKC